MGSPGLGSALGSVWSKTIYVMTGNSCLIYYVTASFVYKGSFTPFRSDAYEEKPRCLDLLHAFFALNALFLDKIGHETLKNHKKRVECTLQVQERITNLNQALLIRRRQI